MRPDRLDFFISHAGSDNDWAHWLAYELSSVGYTVELDVWNWAAGMDFIQETSSALERAGRMLAVWTPDYFVRKWADLEHRVGFAAAQAKPGWLVPVIVRHCPDEAIPTLYRTLIRVDLVDLTEQQARARLLAELAGPRRPSAPPRFPGAAGPGHFPGRLPRIWNVPSRNTCFTGRDTALAEVHTRLAAASSHTVAIVAAGDEGGTGKSELAAEYAWRHADAFQLVWWTDAGQEATAEAGLIELAIVLDIPALGGRAAVLAALREELGRRSGWLLVLDNVSGPELLDRLALPATGQVLVTTRERATCAPDRQVSVGRFSRAESVRLLLRRCPWLSHHAANRTAAIVADLPLAVGQAAAFIAQTEMGGEEYVPQLTESARRSGGQSDSGLAATVALGLDRLATTDPGAADRLDQFVLLAPEPVPLTAAIGDLAPVPGLVLGDPQTTSEIVSSLTGLRLATQDGTSIQLHVRVHDLIARSLTGHRRTVALGRALRLLGTASPVDPTEPANWPLYAALTPHVQAASAHLSQAPYLIETAAFEDVLDRVCRYLWTIGQLPANHSLSEATYHRRRRVYGPDHRESLRWATNLGAALTILGQHQAAHDLLADTSRRLRRTVGDDDPLALRAAEVRAVALTELGEHETAHALLLDTFTRRQHVLGASDPETLRSATELGISLRSRGYQEQARRLLDIAAAGRRQQLGPDHPDTLTSAYHLGLALAALGDHESARHALADTLARQRRVLGRDHPDAVASAYQLGLVLAQLGDHAAASRTLEDATARYQHVLGADHPDTLRCSHYLGLAYAASGERGRARELLTVVVDRRRVVLGRGHPDTLDSAHHLGLAHIAAGDHPAARQLLDDTLTRQRNVLGPNDPDTLDTERIRRGI